MAENNKPIAHVRQTDDGEWLPHDLVDHLQGVARQAAEFAAPFRADDWARIAGLWHDLGKFHPDWQNYLCRETGYNPEAHIKDGTRGRINHSDAGMRWGFLHLGEKHPAAKILAYLIGGHHAGLPDWSPDYAGGDLVSRLPLTIDGKSIPAEETDRIARLLSTNEIMEQAPPSSAPLQAERSNNPQGLIEYFHLWIRMLYSCLVDADFLDTEAFMNPDQAKIRGNICDFDFLSHKLDEHLAGLMQKAPDTPVNRVRAEVLEACRNAAVLKPGFFSLNVPTGGGKTLSSMVFALAHARQHGKKRIIMAIPYTSIIEQTAAVYKKIFGEENVIEHHSNLDPDNETAASRLAAENWDAPIIVTTNVQLFESLFAARSSACRKLHNLNNSVIILDEAQMLPPEFLRPILSVLQGLEKAFGTSIVFCTATQPVLEGAIGSGQARFIGIPEESIQPIIADPKDLSDRLTRVTLDISRIEEQPGDWQPIADELAGLDQVLCILNRRADARELHALMPEGTIHLSALMCPEERSLVIAGIKQRLKDGAPVRVISTQLVEAGVDIDFPVVYRALAGLDSLAQAAGRCNREGRLNEDGRLGRVVVFAPPKPAPPGLLRKGENAARSVLHGLDAVQIEPAVFRRYFEQFFCSVNDFDKPKFLERMVKEAPSVKFQFRSLARDFNLIDSAGQVTVIIHFDKNHDLIDEIKLKSNSHLLNQLERIGPNRDLMRRLGRYSVIIPQHQAKNLVASGMVSERGGFLIAEPAAYEPGKGLLTDFSTDGSGVFV